MARQVFPNFADKLVFIPPQTRGGALRSGAGTRFVVYLDRAATAMADILTMNRTPIPGSEIVVGSNSMLPDFFGPDGESSLWLKPTTGGATSKITAEPIVGIGDGSTADGVFEVGLIAGDIILDSSSRWTIVHGPDDVIFDEEGDGPGEAALMSYDSDGNLLWLPLSEVH